MSPCSSSEAHSQGFSYDLAVAIACTSAGCGSTDHVIVHVGVDDRVPPRY